MMEKFLGTGELSDQDWDQIFKFEFKKYIVRRESRR